MTFETPSEPDRLIAHIVERYHEVHRREFPEAIRLARQVENAHPDRADCPRGISDLLAAMFGDLESHQQKEERMLFPMMRAGGRKMTGLPIGRMRLEHDQSLRQLEQLAELTADFTPPPDACATWRSLYAVCRKLDVDLRQHMRLENDVLFPQYGAAGPRNAGPTPAAPAR